jgi:ectoine utilization protein EutC
VAASTVPITTLNEQEVRSLIDPKMALEAVREAFAKLALGEVTLPDVLDLDLPEQAGEFHVKGAYVHGSPFYSIKTASGFFRNPEVGLPVGAGMVCVFDSATGMPIAILFDHGYLTDLRTGAAGALAADLLAREDASRAAIIGCGIQGRYQLEALLGVRKITHVDAFDLSPASAQAYAEEMSARHGIAVSAVASAQQAVTEADIVVTTTPSRQPYFAASWLHPGVHVTAMGADMPAKNELEAAVMKRADKVVADSLDQCVTQGEIHHAVAAGTIARDDVYAELGEIAAGLKPGRSSDAEITVADLTGVGVQDAAVANIVVSAARASGIGRILEGV